MRIVALCPTYRRPRRLLDNTLACFLAQTHADKRLMICDDSGERADQESDDWAIMATPRFRTLPAKYNAMARRAFDALAADAVAVFEDDDVYLPGYLAAHAAMLEDDPTGWSHCSWVWTDGTGGADGGGPRRENTGHGRLHGCLAMSRACYVRVGGWPDTARMDFDLQLLARLRAYARPLDPCELGGSQYMFRWATTGAAHGQSFSTGPDDEEWLAKAQAAIDAKAGPFRPQAPPRPIFDLETARLINQVRAGRPWSAADSA